MSVHTRVVHRRVVRLDSSPLKLQLFAMDSMCCGADSPSVQGAACM